MPEARDPALPSRPRPDAAPSFRARTSVFAPVRALLQVPLYGGASALVTTTAANAGLGLVYWTLAARLFSTEELGRGAASIAALQLVSMLGCSGLTPALIRFIPAARASTRQLVFSAYLAGISIALICALGFVVATQLFIEPLAVPGFIFLLAVAAWAVFTLEDGALIGLREEGLVPVENALFGLIKLGLLVVFSAVGAWGIFASWSIAAAALIVPVNVALFTVLIPRHSRGEPAGEGDFGLEAIGRFAGVNHVSALLMSAPDFLMPIIVLEIEGAEKTAFFYAAWSLVWPLRLIAVNIANAFTAQAAADEQAIPHLLRRASVFSVAIFLPLVAVLIFASHPLLKVLFGTEYAANGDWLMRLLAPGLFGFAVVSLYVALARVRRQLGRLMLLAVFYAAIALPLNVILVSVFDINGAGVAWFLAQSFLAVAAVLISSLHLARIGGELELAEGSREV